MTMRSKAFVAPRPLRPLRSDERRYFVSISELPAAMQQRAECRSKRSCVETTDLGGGKRRRLEVDWQETRIVLHSWADMGSCGYPSKFYMYLDQHLRGFFFMDPLHRRHDNTVNSVKGASLTWARMEMSIVSSVKDRPLGR